MRVVTFDLAGFALAMVVGGLPGLAFGDPTLPAPSVQAASKTPRLDDTGLTTCLDTSIWLPTACAGTGQDGEFGRDAKHPDNANGVAGFSFVKVCNNGKQAGQAGCLKSAAQGTGPHDWGCTKDLVTGLTWELRTSDGSIRDAHRFFSNLGTNDPADAGGLVAAMNAQALCGAVDWRLPSVTELFSLANLNESTGISKWIPDLDYGYDLLWTSELDGNLLPAGEFAWAVDLTWSSGYSEAETIWRERDGRVESTAARVVRGRVTLAHLVPMDDEVVDTVNHLSWRRCVEGMTWQAPDCVGTPTLLYWSDALAYAKGVAASTGVGWRLPNVKELQSIQSLSRKVDIDHSLFPQTPASYYWSSSGLSRYSIYRVSFGTGSVSTESGVNESNYVIRLVRDADLIGTHSCMQAAASIQHRNQDDRFEQASRCSRQGHLVPGDTRGHQ
jgi:hypothetical protein